MSINDYFYKTKIDDLIFKLYLKYPPSKKIKKKIAFSINDCIKNGQLIVNEFLDSGYTNRNQLAYIMATAWHESFLMPTKEIRQNKPLMSEEDEKKYYTEIKDRKTRINELKRERELASKPRGAHLWKILIHEYQECYWHTEFMGRGFVQLTWKSNYRKFEKILGFPFTKFPDKVLNPEVGAKIIVHGMMKDLFRQKCKISHYIDKNLVDFYNAREIINGDKYENGKSIEEIAVFISIFLTIPNYRFNNFLELELMSETSSSNKRYKRILERKTINEFLNQPLKYAIKDWGGTRNKIRNK